jgi:hypothetical protein
LNTGIPSRRDVNPELAVPRDKSVQGPGGVSEVFDGEMLGTWGNFVKGVKTDGIALRDSIEIGERHDSPWERPAGFSVLDHTQDRALGKLGKEEQFDHAESKRTHFRTAHLARVGSTGAILIAEDPRSGAPESTLEILSALLTGAERPGSCAGSQPL